MLKDSFTHEILSSFGNVSSSTLIFSNSSSSLHKESNSSSSSVKEKEPYIKNYIYHEKNYKIITATNKGYFSSAFN